MITVIVVESLALLREGIIRALSDADDITVIGYCTASEVAIEFVPRERPDVVVMGLALSEVDGAETARRIIEAWPQARILLHARDPASDRARAVIKRGVAVVPENITVDTLIQAIRDLAGH